MSLIDLRESAILVGAKTFAFNELKYCIQHIIDDRVEFLETLSEESQECNQKDYKESVAFLLQMSESIRNNNFMNCEYFKQIVCSSTRAMKITFKKQLDIKPSVLLHSPSDYYSSVIYSSLTQEGIVDLLSAYRRMAYFYNEECEEQTLNIINKLLNTEAFARAYKELFLKEILGNDIERINTFARYFINNVYGLEFPNIRLHFKSVDGKTISLWIDGGDSIEFVKYIISEHNACVPSTIRMVYNGKELEDVHTIDDYNIPFDSTINITFRLLGGSNDESGMTSLQQLNSSEFDSLLKQYVKGNYQVQKCARQIKELLEKLDIIKDSDTFDDVKQNKNLCTLLAQRIGLLLSDTVYDSIYGCERLTDYDLFFNCDTNTKFNDHCTLHGIEYDTPIYEQLKVMKTRLRRWVYRMRDQLIVAFELPDTPDSREARRKNKTKQQQAKEWTENMVKEAMKVKQEGEVKKTSKQNKREKDKYNKKKFLGRRSSNDGSTSSLLDLYETEQADVVLDYLCSFLFKPNQNLIGDIIVWECCCGKSMRLVEELAKIGFKKVVKSDIVNYENVDFTYDVVNKGIDGEDSFKEWNLVVTNPPFNRKKEFLTMFLKQSKPFAMILPMSVLNLKYAKELFKTHHCVVIPISPCVKFTHEGKSKQVGPVGWFVGNVDNVVSYERSIFNVSIIYVDRTKTVADYDTSYDTDYTSGGNKGEDYDGETINSDEERSNDDDFEEPTQQEDEDFLIEKEFNLTFNN